MLHIYGVTKCVYIFILVYINRISSYLWIVKPWILQNIDRNKFFFNKYLKAWVHILYLTWVIRQYSPTITLANGSERPEASEPIKDLAWYMWARTWKVYQMKIISVSVGNEISAEISRSITKTQRMRNMKTVKE